MFASRPLLMGAGFAAALVLTACESPFGECPDRETESASTAPFLGKAAKTSLSCAGPPEPPDGGFSGKAYGCGDFEVALQTRDSMSILRVYTTMQPASERDTSYVDTLGPASSIRVNILRYARPQHLYSVICDDVADDDEPHYVDSLHSGLIEVRTSGLPRPTMFHPFRIDVVLRDVVMKSGVQMDSVRFDSVSVGWMPG